MGDIDSTAQIVDHYRATVFQEKSLQGESMYPVPQQLVKKL